MTTADLPAVNAALNSIATVLIVAGLLAISRQNKKLHGILMALALATSAAFLTCYLIYHANHGSKGSSHMGAIRPLYLTILISHVILAIVNLPMIIGTVLAAIQRKWERHKRWARWTFPVWLYVSVTGVIVYMMLYQWFPAP